MKINFKIQKDSNKKIYLQLYEGFKNLIENSTPINSKIKFPSVRQVAIKFDINILTVLKAYDLLEKNNYIYKIPGKGTFIKEKKLLSSLEQKPITNNFAILNNNINFASTAPEVSYYPIKKFQFIINENFKEHSGSLFNYFDSQGLKILREIISEKLKIKEIHTTYKNIQIISGSQQGLDLIKKYATKRKIPTIVVGTPVYYGVLNTFSENANLITVPLLEDGFDLNVLEKILKQQKIDFLYTMINFENPAGISWSLEKK